MKNARNIILKKVKDALHSNSIPLPKVQNVSSNVFADNSSQDMELLFAGQYTKVGGQLIHCKDTATLLSKINTLLDSLGAENNIFCAHKQLEEAIKGTKRKTVTTAEEAEISITGCQFLVARTGSIVFSDEKESRANTIAAPVHIVIATNKQILFDLQDVFKQQKELPSMLSFVTGPSRTADIEKKIVVGVHGPQLLYLLLTNG